MLHIYRQITALKRFYPVVITQKREEPARFPLKPIIITRKPWTHFLRRFWFRKICSAPWQISASEVKQLTRILSEKHAQLLHIYFGHIAVHLLPLIRTWPRPVVVSFHGADVFVDMEKPSYRDATRRMLDAVRLVLVRSESLERELINLGCARDKIRIQRTAIPLEEVPFQSRSWPNDGSWRLLQACRLIEKKGLRTSLRAFATFAKTYPAATFTIAGEGPLQNEIERLARQLGIAERVIFTGFIAQKELRQHFYDSQIFLHPSETGSDRNQEGVPNSMLEAMASGLPVFATRHGGIPEAIEDGVSGVLVDERDHAALAQRLLEWVRQPEGLSTMASAGSKTIAQKFEQSAQTHRLEEIYFEALGRKAGRNAS